MSGSELLKTMQAIDENARDTTSRVGAEVKDYILDHQSVVIEQLRAFQVARIPTSIGNVDVTVSDLRKALEAKSLAA
jgi:hypothetical protein